MAAKTNELPSFIRTGAAGLESGQASQWLKLEAGKPVEVICLTGVEPPQGEAPNGHNSVVSFDQYTHWIENPPEGVRSPIFVATGGPYDPGHILGLDLKPKHLMLVQVVGEDDEKILTMGPSIFKQMIDIETDLGESLAGHVVKITRTGEKMKTRYRVTATTRVFEIEGEPSTNLIENIGVTDRGEICKMLEAAGIWPPVGGDPMLNAPAGGLAPKKSVVKGKAGSAGTKAPAQPAAAPVVEELTDDQDDAPFATVEE